jgi:hypothetical protein
MSDRPDIKQLAPWLERAWMDRYLARALSASESAWWEVYVLSRPPQVRELELDATLAQLARDLPVSPPAARPGAGWMLLAATLAACCVGLLPARSQPSPVAVMFLDDTRGASDHLRLPKPGAMPVVVTVAIPMFTARAELKPAHGPALKLQPAADGTVSFLLNAGVDAPLSLRLTLDTDQGPVERVVHLD